MAGLREVSSDYLEGTTDQALERTSMQRMVEVQKRSPTAQYHIFCTWPTKIKLLSLKVCEILGFPNIPRLILQAGIFIHTFT